MYNPQNLHECEKEKKRNPRVLIDTAMTGVGMIASLSSILQVLKIWNTGEVLGISLTTQIMSFIAVMTWFSYGVYIKNKPLIITSGLSTVVLGVVVVQVLIYM